MNITPTKIIRELKKHGWENINELLIKDILKIIDYELMKHKNISIKK